MLDEIDHRLLRLLRLNGRRSNIELAHDVGLSPSACSRRIRQLEARGVIRGYTAILAPEAVGGVAAIVMVTLERQTDAFMTRFEAAVRTHPEIEECLLMTGNADYMLRVSASSAGAYDGIHKQILARLPGVARLQSSFVIRDVTPRAAASA